MDSEWYSQLQKAKKSSIMEGSLKKIHYQFEDGREMVEEYNMETEVLSRRAWKTKTKLGGDDDWEIEIGDPIPAGLKKQNDLITENVNQPFITRRVTRKNLEWRIRNLPYPAEVFSVMAEGEHCMVVRTSNKKYFKRITIPDLERINQIPQQQNISFSHKFNTLIITYQKPQELISLENAILQEVKTVATKTQPDLNSCKQS